MLQRTLQSPKALYQNRLNDGVLKPDAVQADAVKALELVYQDVLAFKPAKGWFSRKSEPPRGLYMHGGVGRGKSMLMDLFFDCLPAHISKRRVHFHAFMIEVHDYIHSRRDPSGGREGIDATLPLLASIISERSRVLCFDEFHVTDVADAMILGRLFRELFDHDVVVISTSNWPPDRLYEGGLQRDRFLPFIELLKARQAVLHLDSPHDYRTHFLMEEGSYFNPLCEETTRRMNTLFNRLTDDALPNVEILKVKGREIVVERSAKGVARFAFAQLCARAHGAEDYLAIAEAFHTVFLEDVPRMGKSKRNEAKRLMTLIDVLYEAGTRLVMSADALPVALYSGNDHAFEFERTISRLREMQSADYLEGWALVC